MARTIPERTWTAVRRAFDATPDTSPRALGKLARAHGLRLPELRERMEREGWHAEVRRRAATRREKAAAKWIEKGRARALRDLARLLPLLRSGKRDQRSIRALALAAFHAGDTLSNLYSSGSMLVESRDELERVEAGKPGRDDHPWGYGFPKRRRAIWG